MTDALRKLDLDGTTAGTAPEDATDMVQVEDVYDLEGQLMTNPGTPFDRLLEARGLSREDAIGLVVDDDDGVIDVVPDLLMASFNVRVESAARGKKGLDLLERHLGNVCFVLSDTEMPNMSGPEMLRAAKDRGLLHRVPVAIATANMEHNASAISALMEDGIAHIALAKPFYRPEGEPVVFIAAFNNACLQILQEMEAEAAKKTLGLASVNTEINSDGVDEKALGQEEAPVVA